MTLDDKEYTYAVDLNKSPTMGELLDASCLSSQDSEHMIQARESQASGEQRDEVILTGEKRQTALNLLQLYIMHMKRTSVLMTLNYTDDTCTVLNNITNEELLESEQGELSLVTAFGQYYAIQENGFTAQKSISTVGLLEKVLELAKQNENDIEFKAVNAGGGYVSYQVLFNSIEAFSMVYDSLTDEEKANLVDAVKEQAAQIGEGAPKVCFEFIAGNDWSLNVYNTVVVDDEYVLNWYFEGFYELFNWDVSKAIYNSKQSNETRLIALEETLKSAQDTISAYSKVKIDYATGDIELVEDGDSD